MGYSSYQYFHKHNVERNEKLHGSIRKEKLQKCKVVTVHGARAERENSLYNSTIVVKMFD